ncbi:hypothetical protein [Nocardia thailandica]
MPPRRNHRRAEARPDAPIVERVAAPAPARRPMVAAEPAPPQDGTPRAVTAPYTFVPFAPTVTTGDLWRQIPESTDLTRSFDRIVPGTETGHLDLTITALSPLHLGPTVDGGPFRWPDGTFAVPAYSLRGMVRAQLSTLLGGALGLPADWNPVVLDRDPVPGDGADVQQVRHTTYLDRRGASARVGRQRVGLLDWDGESDTATVLESRQQQLPLKRGGTYNKVPSVQWTVVREDLPHPGGDFRDHLRELRGTTVWTVWATVVVDGVPRPVVFALGRSAEEAKTNATRRHGRGRAGIDAVAPLHPTGKEPDPHHAFLGFLSATWTRQGLEPTDAHAMIFFPTNLANLDADGVAIVRTRNQDPAGHRARNCYLLPLPDATLPGTMTSAASAPLPVEPAALRTLAQVLTTRPWENVPGPAVRRRDREGFHGWPVFFDTGRNGRTVTTLGGSGGFPIAAAHTVTETVTAAGGTWATRIAATITENDAVTTVLGAVDGNRQIAARIDIGHATATAKTVPLPALPVVLMSPNVQSAHTRLLAADGDHDAGRYGSAPTAAISYSNRHPRYRGREQYWHRGDWDGDGSAQWREAVRAHTALSASVSENTAAPADGDGVSTLLAPLPVGTTFRARVTFTNLTAAELGALLFVLRFPGTAPTDFAHKLGGGQPLGLGSVAVTADLFRHTAARYEALDADGIEPDDGAAFITAFRATVGWTRDQAAPTWRVVEETGESWPPHVAAWLVASRWRNRPAPALTAETAIAGHRHKIPMLDVFEVGDRPPAPPANDR